MDRTLSDRIHNTLSKVLRVSAMVYVFFAILGALLCSHVLYEIQQKEDTETQEAIDKAKKHFSN
jgi:hypothetical protein